MRPDPLPRRRFLQLMAGVPLAFGLWRLPLALADGEEACEDPAPQASGPLDPTDGVKLARKTGRPILAIESPADYMARQRLARQLHALLERDDATWRHVLANVVIVVAPIDALRELFPELPINGCKDDPRAEATLIETCREVEPGHGATLATGLCDENAPGWSEMVTTLQRTVLGLPALERRGLFERDHLTAEGAAAVEGALSQLGSDPQVVVEAVRVLAGYRDSILATLTLVSLHGMSMVDTETAAQDAEIAAHCAGLLTGPVSGLTEVRPLGTHWANFRPGCGVSDPYQDRRVQYRCGRGSVSGELRPYLQLLTTPPG